MSYYGTQEHESFLLKGNAILYDIMTDSNAETVEIPRGIAFQEDFADNSITVTSIIG